MRPNALIVDDDLCTLEILPAVLGLHLPSLIVDTSSSRKAAFEHIDAKSYSVVVAEIDMPDMDGFSLLAKMRVSETETPVIFMSGGASVGLVQRAFGAGVFDLLPKPFRRETLIASLFQALRAQGIRRDMYATDQRLVRVHHRLRRLESELTALRSQAVRLLNPRVAEAAILHSRALAGWNQSKALIEEIRKQRRVLRQALRAITESACREAWARVRGLG